ncbi:hypothetical protein [Leptospira jelokensis]|uniref:hypothetical protein n=1 Tax=Leptospira jelokensis TaxID=2484931 RepID=UPI001090BEBD|nr:hypothetical protein [Leptospira jelokensis]TGM06503.1 hypothetical protein EHQ79_00650 [Leptospira jelokensis]
MKININRINVLKIISSIFLLFLISKNFIEIKSMAKLYLNYADIKKLYANLVKDRDATTIIHEVEEVTKPIRKHCNSMIYVIPEFMNPNLVDSHQAVAFALLPCKAKLVEDPSIENFGDADFILVYKEKLSDLRDSIKYQSKNQSKFYTLLGRVN